MSDDSETKQMAIKMWEKVLKKTHQKTLSVGGQNLMSSFTLLFYFKLTKRWWYVFCPCFTLLAYTWPYIDLCLDLSRVPAERSLLTAQ